MECSSLQQSKQILLQKFASGLPIKSNDQLNGQFNLVSAGLYNYLPSINFKDHETIFTNLHLHKKMSLLEQCSLDAFSFTTLENYNCEIGELLKNKPSIICTFHTGSYRLINLFLVKEGIPFSLVVGKEVIEKEGNLFTELHKRFADKEDIFTIIDAEASHSALQMIRELKKGKTLLIYLDGNTGAGCHTSANENSCYVDFLNQQLIARKGVGFLAHAANVPIIPVICYRQSWTDIRLRFHNPIYPLKEMEREEFALKTTQQLYDLVAPIVKRYPEQWEAWLYIHKVARIINGNGQEWHLSGIPAEQSGVVIFNAEKFGLYKIGKQSFLLQKSTYFSYPVTRAMYKVLSECTSGPVDASQINRHLFYQLYNKQVLVKT